MPIERARRDVGIPKPHPLIENREIFESFRATLPPLPAGYAYLLSLSARNKYLSEAERKHYNLGKTEMFGRTMVKDIDDFDFYLRKLASNLVYKKTRSGLDFPEKALVVYLMINPVDMVSAYFVFQDRMNKFLREMFRAKENNKTPNYHDLINMDHHLLTSMGKASRQRDFIDIDFDSKDEEILEKIKKRFEGYTYHIVSTQGGYHFLVPKNQRPSPPVHSILGSILAEHREIKELTINKNAMIPLPGTFQAGTLVGFERSEL
jgi:hypothetical protein